MSMWSLCQRFKRRSLSPSPGVDLMIVVYCCHQSFKSYLVHFQVFKQSFEHGSLFLNICSALGSVFVCNMLNKLMKATLYCAC
jgi:hypothetical protein